MGSDEPTLPSDIKKEQVRKCTYPEKTPKTGDEVRIHYTGFRASDGFKFDSSYASPEGKPYSFKLGLGQVMEAWDRIVATMKKGEVARFTIPEMYLNGGPAHLLAKIPEDCDVTYEVELVGVTSITDLFVDGGVIQTGLDDGEDYGRPPKAGDEVLVDYELQLVDGTVLERRGDMDYKIGTGGSSSPPGIISAKILDKALLSMKPKAVVSLRCRPDYAFGDCGNKDLAVPPSADVVVKLELKEICEVEDVGKKASWSEGLVVKKAIKVIRHRLVPGMDGTPCTVKLAKVTCREEEIHGPETFEIVPGRGDLCDALECACARMRKGEVALVTVKGPSNLLSPGKPEGVVAPVDAPVVYHLEMVDFGRPPPDDGPSSNSERLCFCAEQKERGSAHFRAGRARLAQERYSRIIELLPRYKRESGSSSVHVEFFEDEEDRQRAQELKSTCRLNLAACALKLDEFYAAARHCNDVLQDDPQNLKALYRRAQGLLGSKDFDDAANDCKRIMELEPGNREAQVLQQKIARAEKEEAKAQRAQFGGKLKIAKV